jgi:hypothetical protein
VKFLRLLRRNNPRRLLAWHLHRHLAGTRPARDPGVVHASELTREDGFCARFYALADGAGGSLPQVPHTTSQAVVWHQGRTMQSSVAHWFAEMGMAVGDWACLACGRVHSFTKRPKMCLACRCRALRAVEVRFTSAVSGASCGIDLLLDLGEPKLAVVEIKTIGADAFKALVAPLAEHRLRTNLYLRIVAESGDARAAGIGTDRATVLYVSKGGFGTAVDESLRRAGITERFSPFKEYEIVRDDAATDGLVENARVVKEWRAAPGALPGRLCSHRLVRRAQTCPLAQQCFAGDSP